MSWKDKVAKLLLAFYNTIEPATDPTVMFKKSWQSVDGGSVFYEQKTLVAAIECLLEDKTIGANYSQHALSQLIATRLTAVFAKEPDQIRTRIDGLLSELSKKAPETMNVFMSIQGVSFSQRMKIGEFEFIPAKDFDRLGLQFPHDNMKSHVKKNMWKNQSHVMVSVSACEPGKAKEKAYAEFQWLENAIRLFIGFDHCDVGISSFRGSSIENSLVTAADGSLRGTSSSLKGAFIPFPLEEALAPGSPFYCVIDKLGRKQNELTELQRRIRHAVYLGGLSVCETVPEIAYFLCVSAFETLFHAETDKYVSPSIAQQIVETFCFLIADEDKRRKTFEQMRPFYGKRSAVAHGGKTKVTHKDIRLVQAYLRGAVLKLVNDPTLSTLKTMDDISNLVRDRKFGV
jgi:hypothetical protein